VHICCLLAPLDYIYAEQLLYSHCHLLVVSMNVSVIAIVVGVMLLMNKPRITVAKIIEMKLVPFELITNKMAAI